MLKIQNKIEEFQENLIQVGQVRADEEGSVILVTQPLHSEYRDDFNYIYLIDANKDEKRLDAQSYEFMHRFSKMDIDGAHIALDFPYIVSAKLVLEGIVYI